MKFLQTLPCSIGIKIIKDFQLIQLTINTEILLLYLLWLAQCHTEEMLTINLVSSFQKTVVLSMWLGAVANTIK